MELAERFYRRFRGLGRAHGIFFPSEAERDRRGKVRGRSWTVKEKVTVEKFADHLNGVRGLGIVPIDDDNTVSFGAIDVDVYDLDLFDLERKIRAMNLPLIVCRTKSGGAHLYLFLSSPAPAIRVREKLMEWSVVIGYPQVEIFPKQSEIGGEDDVGSWINLPYFGGDSTDRYAVVEGRRLTTSEFVDCADAAATTIEEIEKTGNLFEPEFADAPPCIQRLSVTKIPEGARNNGLYNVGVFCKMKFGDAWIDRLREYGRRLLSPPLEEREIENVVRSLSKKSYFYKCRESPIVSMCNRVVCGKRRFGIGKSSDDPGVVVDGMTKILTNPPVWLMNVNGKRIQFDSADDFLIQSRFAKLCVESVNVVPNRVSDQVWRNLIRDLLEKLEEVEAPADAGMKGEFFSLLERYCSERSLARDPEELLLGKPLLEDGWIMFRSMDMIEWMRRRRFFISAREAWTFLREIGAKTKNWNVKGKHIRTWVIPAFSRQTESFSVPEIASEEEEF